MLASGDEERRSQIEASQERRSHGTRRSTASAMIDAEIEADSGGEEELIPSSGFLASVMECVEEEAAAPPPIPFPVEAGRPRHSARRRSLRLGRGRAVSLRACPQLSSARAHPAASLRASMRYSRRVGWLGGAGAGRLAALLAALAPPGRTWRAAVSRAGRDSAALYSEHLL